MRIAISTGGGDAPGLNSVIRSATLAALRRGWDVVGIRDGRTATESMRVAVLPGLASEDRATGDLDAGLDAGRNNPVHPSSVVAHTLVVDDVGRVQLPADIIEALGITGRVSADVVADHARLRPVDSTTGLPRRAPDENGES